MTTSTTNTAARELLASALDECGRPTDAAEVREGRNPFVRGEYALAAIEKSLTQQRGGEQVDDDMVSRFMQEASEQGLITVQGTAVEKSARAILAAALRSKQPAASEGDERREYDAFAGAINVLLSHGIATSKAVEIARDLSDNTSKQAAGEAVVLERWGFPSGISSPAERCADGYWTPWHIAQSLLSTTPRHPADEKVQIKSSTIELALFEEENETAYPGYARLHIPYDAWNWDMNIENLLVNRKNIDFAQTTKDYYNKTPITHIRAAVDGKAQRIRLSGFLSLGPAGITPSFSAGQLCIAVL